MDDSKIVALYKSLEIKERAGFGNQRFKYVSSADVIDRMNKIFDGCWHTTVVSQELIEDQVIVRVRVSVYDDTTKREYSHEGYGGSVVARYTSGINKGKPIDLANTFKSAEAKAIKNACSRWGVGLYLEAQDIEDFVENESNANVMSNVRQSNVSIAELPPFLDTKTNDTTQRKDNDELPPFMSNPRAVDSNIGKGDDELPPFMSNTSAVDDTNAKSNDELPPFMSSPHVGGSNTGDKTGTLPPFLTESKTETAALELTQLFQSAASPPIKGDNKAPTNKITDIQKAAIENIIEIRLGNSMSYDDIARAALTLSPDAEIPSIEDLSYNDAVRVINYGNNSMKRS